MTDSADLTDQAAGPHVVIFPEEIDLGNAQQADRRLSSAITAGRPLVIADLSQTIFCDSAGVRVLYRAYHDGTERGCEVRFVIPHPGVQRVLQLSGLDQVLPLYDTLELARGS